MSKYLISVKDREGKFKHFSVPEEIAIYIKQLEMCIKYPNQSKLKEIYKERFK